MLYEVITILYGFLFTILQVQDYALLIGSIGLFVVLAIVMTISSKINRNTTGEES